MTNTFFIFFLGNHILTLKVMNKKDSILSIFKFFHGIKIYLGVSDTHQLKNAK